MVFFLPWFIIALKKMTMVNNNQGKIAYFLRGQMEPPWIQIISWQFTTNHLGSDYFFAAGFWHSRRF
jgi:hypothetical protein